MKRSLREVLIPCPIWTTTLALRNTAWLFVLTIALGCTPAREQFQPNFRWLSPTADRAMFQQVGKVLASELRPDSNDPESHTVPMKVKFIERIGIQDEVALVLIGEKQDASSPDAVYLAFNVNLRTGTRLAIRAKGVEWLWAWRMEKVTHLTGANITDVVFTFADCVECEEQTLLASFQYDPQNKRWEIRDWAGEKAVLVDSHRQFGDDGIYYYDCLHTVADLTGDGLDDVAIRCREGLDKQLMQGWHDDPIVRNAGKEAVTKDETLLYAANGDHIQRVLLSRGDPRKDKVQAALCSGQPDNLLCKR